MTQPDFDWTFDDAPLEGEARAEAGGGPGRPGLSPPRRPRRPWPRWAWLALLGLAAAGLLGGYLFTRLGWLRLEAQIAAEVAYDDARARAREVDAVLAAQATTDAFWRSQRAAEVRLGLPAPLPAGHLRPTSYPAEVVAVEALGGNLFAATVRRRYTDSAGQVVSFDLVQRYLNLAPGAWQRLATDLSGLVAATIVSGARLSATVPTNDLPWLRPALLAADQALLAACDLWQSCPEDYQLPLVFNAGLDLLHPSAPPRAPSRPAYPLIFDLTASPPGDPPRYVLSAPQVIGRPADAAAQDAYNRALSATVLGYMAGEISGLARHDHDYFLDALVAQMETQLGLSAAAAVAGSPLTFQPAEALWGLPPAGRASRADWDDRQQVWALMNLVLADQPPAVAGDLLRRVHQPPGLTFEAWLAPALGPDAAARAAVQWVTAAQRGLGRPTPEHDWPAAAEGLALLCADSVALVTDGALRPVSPAFAPPAAAPVLLHRSQGAGRYLAANYYVLVGGQTGGIRLDLWVLDQAGGAAPVRVGENAYAVGWGADARLYYLNLSDDARAANGLRLERYDPATGATTPVLGGLSFTSELGWSADRRHLLVTRADPAAPEASQPRPFLLSLGPPLTVQPLAENGYTPVFAPGSTATRGQVAFLRDIFTFGSSVRNLEVHVLDLATGADRRLFDSAQAGVEGLSSGYQLLWSPGGAWLSFSAFGSTAPRLFTIDVAAGQTREWPLAADLGPSFIPVGFSADDRYLAAQASPGLGALSAFALLDLTAAGSAPVRLLAGTSLAWAPAGQRLALANPLGVFLVDAGTGAYQWLHPEPCALDW